jgi:hypothetical protein
VIQSVLPLHECAAESVADPVAAEFIANPVDAKSIAEPLYSIANQVAAGAALTETYCLCVQV